MLTPDGDKQTSPGRAHINGVPASPGHSWARLPPLTLRSAFLEGSRSPLPHSVPAVRSAPGWGWCFSPEKRRARGPGAESRWGSGQHRPGPGRAGRPRTRTRGWRWPRGVLPARSQGGLGNRGPGRGATAVSSPLSASHVGVGSVPAGPSGICRDPASGGETRTGRGGGLETFFRLARKKRSEASRKAGPLSTEGAFLLGWRWLL